jgi:hypothetical protein
MIIHSVEYEGREFRFDPPIETWRDIFGFLVCHFCSQLLNVDELEPMEQIGEHVAFLWDTYACESDGQLSDNAIELKRELLARVSVRRVE